MNDKNETRHDPEVTVPPIVTPAELDAYFAHVPQGHSEPSKLQELAALLQREPQRPLEIERPIVGQLSNKILQHYWPRLLGSGGENYVYEVQRRKTSGEPYQDTQKHAQLIIKIEKNVVKEILNSNMLHGAPLDELPREVSEVIQEYLQKEHGRFQEIKRYFGAEHVLKQKRYLRKIPVNKALLDEFYYDTPPTDFTHTTAAWAVITVQERAAELDQNDVFSATVGFDVTEDVIYEKEYRLLNERFIYSPHIKAAFNAKLFFDIQPDTGLQPLLNEAATDGDLREALKDFVTNTILYATETGEIVDIFGQNNIVFSKKDERWTYRLLDALYPATYFETANLIYTAQELFSKIANGQRLTNKESNVVITVLNFTRTINALAVFLGIKDRLDIIPAELKNVNLDFNFLVKDKFPPPAQRAAA